jgi:hypothetical protein
MQYELDVPPEETQEAHKRKTEREKLEWERWMRRTLETYEGRAVVWELLTESQLFNSSFAGEQPLTMAHAEGRKHVGRFLHKWVLKSMPDAYKVMSDEFEERLKVQQALDNQEDE